MDIATDASRRREPVFGAPVRRTEDRRFLTGSGRFIADKTLPGQTHAQFIRSPHAHAAITGVDGHAALAMPGVLAVLTGADVAGDGLGGIPWEIRPPQADPALPLGAPEIAPPQPVMAADRARFVGEIVAMVVAETASIARDAAELVVVAYEPLPAVASIEAAVRPDAPVVCLQFPDNVGFEVEFGDPRATEAAFVGAAHVTRLRLFQNRINGNPIETRGYIGLHDASDGRHTLYAAAGKPHPIRDTMARFVFRIPQDRIRVITGDVGGGFGAKNVLYPEAVLVLWAAKRVGRPVRWICDRGETFISDVAGRDMVCNAEMAFDRETRILGLKVRTLANIGAWVAPRAVNPVRNSIKIAQGVYHIPAVDLQVKAVLTNTVPTCPIRGAGEPEGIFIPERLINAAAIELGLDPIDIMRANLVPESAMPYATNTGLTFDSGQFERNLDRAIEMADRAGFAARREAARAQGKLRGLAIANVIEAVGFGINESADIRCDADGRVTLYIGTMSNGQGHETVYTQIIAEQFGIDMADITVVQGDTDTIRIGNGTGACRSLTVGGSAVLVSAQAIVDEGRTTAAQLLEAAPEDINFADGAYRIGGTDRAMSFTDVVRAAGGLSHVAHFDPIDYTYPNGSHACEVEVDPETGEIAIIDYKIIHDVGRAANPLIVEGQLHGGLVQGMGQALSEHAVIDPASGQLLTGSFMDYCMPRADDVPPFELELNEVICTLNPLGVKAVGEAGVAAAPPAVINAIIDALAPLGVRDIDMPATPERVLRAIKTAQEISCS